MLSYHPFNLFSSHLLSFQFLSNAIALSYHCSIKLGCHSDFISFWHMVPFISLLNSSTKGLSSYLLSLTALLNSYINSSIFISAKNSSAVSYSNTSISKSSKIFSFQTSADLSYIYDNIHCICSSTTSPIIFILIYSLHTIMNSNM